MPKQRWPARRRRRSGARTRSRHGPHRPARAPSVDYRCPRRRVGAGTVDSAGSLTHLAALRTGTQTDPIAGLLAELVQTANSATACFAEITSVMRSAESPAYNAA